MTHHDVLQLSQRMQLLEQTQGVLLNEQTRMRDLLQDVLANGTAISDKFLRALEQLNTDLREEIKRAAWKPLPASLGFARAAGYTGAPERAPSSTSTPIRASLTSSSAGFDTELYGSSDDEEDHIV